MKFKVNGTGEYTIWDLYFEIDSPEEVFEMPPLEGSYQENPWLYEDAIYEESEALNQAYNKAEKFFKDFKKAAKKVAKKHGVKFGLDKMWLDSYGYESELELLEDDFVPPPPPEPKYTFTASELEEILSRIIPTTISAKSVANETINFKINGLDW